MAEASPEDAADVQAALDQMGSTFEMPFTAWVDADGMESALEQGADPRFGMQVPVPVASSSATPGGLTLSATLQRTATLADPGNVLSLDSLTERILLGGRQTAVEWEEVEGLLAEGLVTPLG